MVRAIYQEWYLFQLTFYNVIYLSLETLGPVIFTL